MFTDDRTGRGTRGRSKHMMVGLPSSRRGSRIPIFLGLAVTCALIVGSIVLWSGDKNVKPSSTEKTAGKAVEPMWELEITMIEVSHGVFHLEFGGWNCDDAQCLERALGLVLERIPGDRIVSVAPIGVYGSPTALVIVTVPVPVPAPVPVPVPVPVP